MAVKVLAAVWDGFPGGGSDLLALLALADWSDDSGRCYPSMAAIASKTRLSRSQAQRVVHGLIEAGYLTVIGNESGGAPGSTRQYRINLGTLRGCMDATPTGRTDATGSAHATGRTDAQEGPHGCAETGRTDATQTVSEPSKNRQHSSPSGSEIVPDGFTAFWEQYPRRVAKPQALKSWNRLKPTGQTLADLMAGLERQKATEQWQKDDGKFVPYPATWLNGRRWEDETTPPVPASSGATAPARAPAPGDTRTAHGRPEVFDDVMGWVPA